MIDRLYLKRHALNLSLSLLCAFVTFISFLVYNLAKAKITVDKNEKVIKFEK